MRMTFTRLLVVVVVAVLAGQLAGAQSAPDRVKVLRAAADALGMARWSDIGANTTRLPAIDVVNTMELYGSGTSDISGRAVKIEYHVALGYNPPAMRVEMTRTGPDGGAPQRTIQTVRENYAWDESEMGAGLVPGKGHRNAGERRLQRTAPSALDAPVRSCQRSVVGGRQNDALNGSERNSRNLSPERRARRHYGEGDA